MGLLKIIVGIILLIIGILFSVTLIGLIIGIPLILLSLLMIISGLIPKQLFKKTFKLIFKIAFACLIVFILFSGITLLFDSGKDFWNQAVVVPVMKPFSESCGSLDHYNKETCQCDGTMLADINEGSTEYYCYGKCGECQCFQLNETSQAYNEVECK